MNAEFQRRGLDFLLSGFAVLLFLSAASDSEQLIHFRVFIGSLLFLFLLISFRNIAKTFPFSLTLLSSLLFLGFQAGRALYAGGIYLGGKADAETASILQKQLIAPAYWGFLMACLGAGYLALNNKSAVKKLLAVMSICGFGMALNAIPPLLVSHHLSYLGPGDKYTLFPALFYFHEFIPRFILSTYGHQNMVGDLMAFGFFPGLAFLLYGFYQLIDSWTIKAPVGHESGREQKMQLFSMILLRSVIVLSIAAAILLVFSRGTIIFWLLSMFFFFVMVMIKRPKTLEIIFVIALLTGGGFFAAWAGNLKAAWKEVQTIKEEEKALDVSYDQAVYKSRTLYTNIEGAKRAKAIFKHYPIWGAGTGGFEKVSLKFSTPGSEDIVLAKFRACNHYLQLLAEEGAGAFLYFLMLLAYGVEFLFGIFRTQSRFKFLAALAFFCPVLTVLGHASINHLMQQYNLSMLVYLIMGASLAVLRKDFRMNDALFPANDSPASKSK